MITTTLEINGITYTVSASTQRGLDAACEHLIKSVEQFEAQQITEIREKTEEQPKTKRKKRD